MNLEQEALDSLAEYAIANETQADCYIIGYAAGARRQPTDSDIEYCAEKLYNSDIIDYQGCPWSIQRSERVKESYRKAARIILASYQGLVEGNA
jgi:hypothetical protein